MYKSIKNIITVVLLLSSLVTLAQEDSIKSINRIILLGADSSSISTITNQDAIYNRPFINIGKTKTAVGGYLEGNTNYFSEDGVSDGFSMEMRRFNIFLYSQIGNKIRFLSELEFEHGTEEIALETALLDFEYNSAFNIRAGILLPAIGLVNTNHDSPNWEFIERPLSSTGIIPSTLSEVGFGAYGKFYPSENSIISYDVYLTNGLQGNVILNSEGRTSLEAGKSEEMFAEDNNGEPMLNGRVGYRLRNLGEFGLAYYGGAYNSFKIEGEVVNQKRNLALTALDFKTKINELTFQGELVALSVDVPDAIEEIYGEKQIGGFADFIYPVKKGKMLKFENSVLNVALRLEYNDYNLANFKTNINTPIGDEDMGLAVGVGFRPISGTVLRVNYSYHIVQDAVGNPAAKVAGIQFGFASYF